MANVRGCCGQGDGGPAVLERGLHTGRSSTATRVRRRLSAIPTNPGAAPNTSAGDQVRCTDQDGPSEGHRRQTPTLRGPVAAPGGRPP